jgi:hypothetical protein
VTGRVLGGHDGFDDHEVLGRQGFLDFFAKEVEPRLSREQRYPGALARSPGGRSGGPHRSAVPTLHPQAATGYRGVPPVDAHMYRFPG